MSKDYGSDGTVENTAYCQDSWQARNVRETNKAMGYDDMSDLANTKRAPVSMVGEKRNTQLSPSLPNSRKND